jgi:nicotinate-nucleotide adenylyltransferase
LRIGLFGGTFDPPHFGHLRLAEDAAWEFGLDRVLFIPSFTPPHKPGRPVTPCEHRLEMTRLACADNPVFEVSDWEVKKGGPSYTVQTLERFASELHPPPFFIMGTDSLRDIRTWREFERIFSLSNFIVVPRPGLDFEEAWRTAPDSLRNSFRTESSRMVHNTSTLLLKSSSTGLNISSTMVRDTARRGGSVRYLTPDSVRAYILKLALYKGYTQ